MSFKLRMTNNERVGLIYKITSPSGKSYIGKTVKSLSERMKGHKTKSGTGCTALTNAINKYGWDELTREIIEENIPEDQLNDREKYWIKTCNTIAPHGYNLKEGGDGGSHSDISKLRMAEGLRKYAIAKNGHRGGVRLYKGLFYPQVTIDKITVYMSRGCKTHEEAVEILQRYTADPERFEMPERIIRPKGSGSVHFVKRQGKWRAKGPRDKHIGVFSTEEEARSALDKYLIANPYQPYSTSSP